jgi:flavodoxin I
MKTLVIYDSVFGNTEQIARVIGNALGPREEVGIFRVNSVKPEQLTGVELLIVGSPTRGFKPTEAVQAFLKGLPAESLKGVRVAVFDTRIDVRDIFFLFRGLVDGGGYAAPFIAKSLQAAGGELVEPLEGFFVKKREGPLKNGELERAEEWAKAIK